MKKIRVLILTICLCFGLCACGSEETVDEMPATENVSETEPPQYEDMLIEQLKIGDSLAKAEEVFGMPTLSTSEYMNPPKKMKYKYSKVKIYALEFEPYVVTDESDNVFLYGYFYGSKVHSAAYENTYKTLIENFTKLYGAPAKAEERSNQWNFEDGTNLLVSNMNVFAGDYWISVEYRKINQSPPTEETQPTNDAPDIAETTETVEGKKYLCTKVVFTDEDYDEFNVADSVHENLYDSAVVISEDRTVLAYQNQQGIYIADLITEYDGEMWYESEVTWRKIPTPYGEHQVTATELIFDEARGLVRMNFSLDGEEGNTWSGKYFIFNEFEIE